MTAFHLPTATPDPWANPTCDFPDSIVHWTNRCTCDWSAPWEHLVASSRTDEPCGDPWFTAKALGVRG